jgi:hypothetical protein
VSNILLKLTGDNDDAKETLDDTIADIKEFGKTEATAEVKVDADQAKEDIASVLADLKEIDEAGKTVVSLKVDAAQAKEDIDEVLLELKAIPKEETIRIRVAAEQSKLEALLARKGGLENQLQNTAAAGGDTDPLIQRLGTYNQRIESVRSRVEGLSSDFDHLGEDGAKDVEKVGTDFGSLTNRITSARTGLVSLVSNIVGKVPLIGGLFSSLTEGVGQLATLLPDAAEGFGGMVASAMGMLPVAGILGAIVVACAALVVSIGEALLGIVALGVAFLAALLPIIALLGIVAIKIKDIVSGQTTLATANANLKTAIDAQTSAVTQLHQAEQTESNTRLAAIAAERQAYDAELDAINQVNDAKLGITSAKLQLDQAKLTLSEFKQQLAGLGTTPGDLFGSAQNVSVAGNFGQTQEGSSPEALQAILLQYKEDLLAVKQGALGTKDAVGTLRDAITNQVTVGATWALYLKEGLKAYQPFAQAVNAVVDAEQNLKRADDQLKASELAKTQALKKGNAEASAFEKAWKDLKATLGKVFGPAEAIVFKDIEKALLILAKHLGPLEPAFVALGKAIGGAFVWWAKMMTKPDNMKLIVGLIKLAVGLTKSMSHWLGEFFKLVLQVAEAAGPSLLSMIESWAKKLGHVNDMGGKIKDFIHECIGKATTFWHILLKIGDALQKIAGFFGTLEKIFKITGQIASAPGNAAAAVLGTGNSPNAMPGSTAGKTAQQILAKLGISTSGPGGGSKLGLSLSSVEGTLANIGYTSAQVSKIAKELKATGQYGGGQFHPTTHIEHQHVAENAKTVGDPDHFARKLRKNMTAHAGGIR